MESFKVSDYNTVNENRWVKIPGIMQGIVSGPTLPKKTNASPATFCRKPISLMECVLYHIIIIT